MTQCSYNWRFNMIRFQKDGPSVITGALIPVGSRHETNYEKGISHFVEHSLFKGTKTRDKNLLKREVEKCGASFNAWTSEEATFYHITAGNEFSNIARDVIQDMVNNSIFPQDEVDPEREVILQELQMYEDDPTSQVFEISSKVIFSENSGLHLPIIGTRDTLKKMTRDSLVNHYNKYYKNAVYIEVGPEPSKHDCDFKNQKFSWEKTIKSSDRIVTKPGIKQANMVLTGIVNFADMMECYFNMGFLAKTMNGFCGRLFDTIREKNHLVYSTYITYQIFNGGTVQYWVYAALDPNNINKARELMMQELTRPVTDDEINFVINKWIGSHQLALDSKESLSSIIINSLVKGYDYNEIINNYKKRMHDAGKQINDTIKAANFTDSKLVAIIPE